MMSFEHGGGLGDSGKNGDGKGSGDAELSEGACVSTKTPSGFDVGPIREKLRGWLGNDPEMTISDFVQTDSTGCFGRATERIPKRWGVLTLQVTCQTPYAAFVEVVSFKLNAPTFKPRVCICEYFKGNPIEGPLSTFGNHWILIIGAGVATNGRRCIDGW